MSNALTQVFSRIPQAELDMALQCGLLLAAASSIFYLFFGKLLSIPELLSTTLKDPKCTSLSLSDHFPQLLHHHFRVRLPLRHPPHLLPRTHHSVLPLRRRGLPQQNLHPPPHHFRHPRGTRFSAGIAGQGGVWSHGGAYFQSQQPSVFPDPLWDHYGDDHLPPGRETA